MSGCRRLAGGCLATLLCLATGAAADVPELVREHRFGAGAVAFRTPAGWTVSRSAREPGRVEASGDELILRFVYREGDSGFDSLHVTCMLERLASRDQVDPRIRYEHDFLSGASETHRFLDSAFVTSYDEPVHGHRAWRQRNVTLVVSGRSLCVIGFAPEAVWRKSEDVRALHDAVLSSVRLEPAE